MFKLSRSISLKYMHILIRCHFSLKGSRQIDQKDINDQKQDAFAAPFPFSSTRYSRP